MCNVAHWLKISTFTAHRYTGMKNVSAKADYSNKTLNLMGGG
jgi:hypothetical protein